MSTYVIYCDVVVHLFVLQL